MAGDDSLFDDVDSMVKVRLFGPGEKVFDEFQERQRRAETCANLLHYEAANRS